MMINHPGGYRLMEQNPFTARMEKMTDDQLKEVIWIQAEDYTEEALQAAKWIAEKRGITMGGIETKSFSQLEEVEDEEEQAPSQNTPTTFEGYLKAIDFRQVEKKLFGTFKESDRNVEKLRDVYQRLLSLNPVVEEPPVYLFLAKLTEEYDGRYPFDLFGIEEDSTEPFGLEMMPWNEWLGLKVHDKTRRFVERLGAEEFVALALRKMTVLGYTEEDIEDKITILNESGFEFDMDEDREDEFEEE
jgi:hypothetical protein